MPSRLLTSPPPITTVHRRLHRLILPVTLSLSSVLLLLLLIVLIYLFLRRYRHRRLHSPTLLPFSPPHLPLTPFSFAHLRSATDSFHPSRLLGRGASASVFRGLLPNGKSVAIKLVLSSSAAADFHNELSVLSSIQPNPFLISLLGYCCCRRRRRRKLLLVYEFMCNGSLQEALFNDNDTTNNKKLTLLSWERRYQIIIDVAQGLDYLHSHCHPPVVHGDIKPSNVLLGPDFRAKIADFGLARFKTCSPPPPFPDPLLVSASADFFSQDLTGTSPAMDFDFCSAVRSSSGLTSSCRDLERKMRPNPIAVMDEDEVFDEMPFKSPPPTDEQCGKDWWWKQDKVWEVSSRDYVRDWIGTQICRPASSANMTWEEEEEEEEEEDTKISNKEDARIEELDEKVNHVEEKKKKKKKDVKVKEWWKEEYFAEMNNKSKCSKELSWFQKKSSSSNNNNDRNERNNWKINRKKKKRSKSTGSDMFSGDLFSRELSSTATSMRGTIGYVAPEHGIGGDLMEKADIYSFGILILVIVSGRRPLHVLSSPMRLERANLISWCRLLASSGNVLDLVDEKLKDCYNKEQANLCVNLALLCLQKLPELRPDTGEIVKILKREMELPVVPVEFSPSPNCKSFSRSRRKATRPAEFGFEN